MGDSEGGEGASSGQALHRDHLQSSEIEGGDWKFFWGALGAHRIATFGGKCGNSTEDGGTPGGSAGGGADNAWEEDNSITPCKCFKRNGTSTPPYGT